MKFTYKIVLVNENLVLESNCFPNELAELLQTSSFAYVDGKYINTSQILYFEELRR